MLAAAVKLSHNSSTQLNESHPRTINVVLFRLMGATSLLVPSFVGPSLLLVFPMIHERFESKIGLTGI
jgi:hypothetical protein